LQKAAKQAPVFPAAASGVMRLKKYLDFKRFGNLPLGLVLEQVSVLIYSRLING